MSSTIDPWVPAGLASGVAGIVAATHLRDGDWLGAGLGAVAAVLALGSAVRSFRRHRTTVGTDGAVKAAADHR